MPRSHILDKVRAFSWVRMLLGNRHLHVGALSLVLLFAACVLLFNNLVMPRYTRAGAAFPMPSVEGLQRAVAESTLLAHDLEAAEWDTVSNFVFPSGTVLEQNPLPGAEVKAGRSVYLVLSDTTRDVVRVPAVITESVSAATNLIRRARLRVRALPDSIPHEHKGVVTRQQPPPDALVRWHDTVIIWYSTGLGNRLVEVPDLVGRPISEARAMLAAAGLIAYVYPPLDTLDLDPIVTMQDQPAGLRVREGRELRLMWEAEEE